MNSDDAAVFVDEFAALCCSCGHAVQSFTTRDLDGPSMSTYLLHGERLYRAEASGGRLPIEGSPEVWRIENGGAVREHRFTLREIEAPLTLHIHGNCPACRRVPARTATASSCDELVTEQAVPVSFRLTFRSGEPVRVERTSTAGDELELSRFERGGRVLDS